MKIGIRETEYNLSLLVGYFSVLLMLIPLFEWVLVPGRPLVYNILNTFIFPILCVCISIVIYFGIRHFDRDKEMGAVSEFIVESWMKIKFLPLALKWTVLVLAIICSFFGTIFILASDFISFRAITLIFFFCLNVFLAYIPIICICWMVDYFREN
ncbi:MAG: hypothetical protein ABJG68_04475 [Crocinitomicaceae bacterium]